MNVFTRRILFLLFFISGLSSLVYQVVWTRLAFASFGIITPVLSVVLSVFMLGLAVGSWAGGRWVAPLTRRTGLSAVFFYAAAELIIGLGAFVVPQLFAGGENLLLASGETNSFGYLFLSALVLAVSLLPWCVCMGITFPFMMAYIRERDGEAEASFSFLYLANVLGAMTGTFMTAIVWIELLGFHHTLWMAAAGNFTIALISGLLGWEQQRLGRREPSEIPPESRVPAPAGQPQERIIKGILFSTGFIAMAMEVVWTRAFTPVLKTEVYSFATIVFTYLGATFFGSWRYRADRSNGRAKSWRQLIPLLAFAGLLPVVLNTPALLKADYTEGIPDRRSVLLLLAGIVPICALLGYLTPSLIDEFSGGNPARAGRVYALNVVGCILGPLFACYALLPHLSERAALILLSLPFVGFCLPLQNHYCRRWQWGFLASWGLVLGWSGLGVEDFADRLHRKAGNPMVIRRDYTATVISFGQGPGRMLLVNGLGMTWLTPITKFMVHLPLACLKTPPQSALVICFGMGTSFRSAMSWNIDTTAVELVPSVTKAFGFYHADAARLENATNGHIITDDGRRFLKRTKQQFDVIVVDPPPPIEAAGSSLLFSREFYELAKRHLKPGGIIQMWYPADQDIITAQAAVRSIQEVFPYLRCFPSVDGWGIHMLASSDPIAIADANTLLARMPESARQDLMEWSPTNAPAYLSQVLNHEYQPADLLNPNPDIQITDDAPFNEYFLLRFLNHH